MNHQLLNVGEMNIVTIRDVVFLTPVSHIHFRSLSRLSGDINTYLCR